MDINPKNNKDTFRTNDERLKDIFNLSFAAWEQVSKNPEEAKRLFKKIHSIASGGEYMMEHPSFYPEKDKHSPNCKWHKDWHACDCGAFEAKKAADKVNGFICDACGERKEGKPEEVINTETLAGIVMCEGCSAPKSCDSSCTDDSCPICGGNTPERVEEQIAWLEKVAEDRKKK